MARSDKEDKAMTNDSPAIAADIPAAADGMGQVIRVEQRGLSRADMAQIESFDEAMAAFGGEIDEATAALVGDGIIPLDKELLVGKKFLVTSFEERESAEFGGTYLVIVGITEKGTKFFITDGSVEAGLRPQLLGYRRRTGRTALLCRNGLTRSDYTRKSETGEILRDDKGAPMTGTTYFLDLKPNADV